MDSSNTAKSSKKIENYDSVSFYDYDIDFDAITVIVPTLDEEEAISVVLDDIITQGYENILVVDGNSKDKTIEIVEQKKVQYIIQKGRGKTGAIISALDYIKTPYIVLIDGDCTYAAKDIQNLFPFISKYDEVIGARSKGRKNITRLNRFGNWMINTYFNILFDSKLSDVCSGMYLLKTEYAKSLKLMTEGFDVEVEIAAYAARNHSITETPINFFSRLGNQKLSPVRDGIKIMSTITKLAIKLQFIRFLSFVAAMLLFPGIIFFSYPFIFSFLKYELSSYFIGMLFLVLSIQGITMLFIDSRFLKKDITNNRKKR